MAALVSSAWEGVAETNPERLAGAISICEAVQVWARAAFSQMQEKWGVISSPPTRGGTAAPWLCGSSIVWLGRVREASGAVSALLWRCPDQGKFKAFKEERWGNSPGV